MTATTPTLPRPLTPSAEPVAYAGLSGTLMTIIGQWIAGGIVTSTPTNGITPAEAIALNTVIAALPTLIGLITRQFTMANAKAQALINVTPPATTSTPPVTTATPVNPSPASPVTTSSTGSSTGSTPVALTVISSTDLPAGTEGSIAAGTRRWSLDGERLSDVGPAIVSLVAIDNVKGDTNNGHFYRTGTDPEYRLTMRDVSVATANPSPPAPVDPYRGLPALTTNDAIVAFEAQPGIAAQEDAAFARFDAALAAYQSAHNHAPGTAEPQAVMIAIAESVNASILRYAGKFGPENNTYSR